MSSTALSRPRFQRTSMCAPERQVEIKRFRRQRGENKIKKKEYEQTYENNKKKIMNNIMYIYRFLYVQCVRERIGGGESNTSNKCQTDIVLVENPGQELLSLFCVAYVVIISGAWILNVVPTSQLCEVIITCVLCSSLQFVVHLCSIFLNRTQSVFHLWLMFSFTQFILSL